MANPFLALALCAGLLVSSPGQKAGGGKPQDVVEVQFNLLIKDANGAPVSDVTSEQVKIFEDNIPQQITSFERKDAVLNYGVVLDHSGSVRSQIEPIIDFAKQLVAGLQGGDQGFLVEFTSADKTSIVQDWTSDRKAIGRALDAVRIDYGQSAVMNALGFAANHLLERASHDNNKRRNALILISDCEDRDPPKNKQEFFANLRNSGIQVFVVAPTGELSRESGLVRPSTQSQAERLANRIAYDSGGVAYVTAKPEFGEILPRLLAELRAQYVIRYQLTNSKRSNDSRRKLRVAITPGTAGATRIGTIREYLVVPKD